MKKTFLLIFVLILCSFCGFGTFWVYSNVKEGNFQKFTFLSSLFSTKQEDLGITYTATDAPTFLNKNGVVATNECPSTATCSPSTATYSGTKTVDVVITNQEGTALINEWIKLSKNAPFSTAQMRVNSDGTVDFTGTVEVSRLKNFGIASKIPEDKMAIASKYTAMMGSSFAIKASGTLSIKNNQVDAKFSQIRAGILDVPGSLFTEQKNLIDSFVEERLTTVPGLSVTELTFSQGKTTFKGTVPQSIIYKK